MRLALILAATFVLAAPLHAAEHDMDWFVKNPKQRAAWLQKCRHHPRNAAQTCENARQADLRAYSAESAAKLDRGTSEPAAPPVPKQ
ncbi:EexN family lipoprotein [Paracraurococcus lichenis]|uniref:EexN family lipoprotein n=1 Tax=Paracraurococcus lichenis TaxID=3064888 RepID=A0ABT9E636_9PROT|nr:EexN family lipoprotein [Paracraurococcus sp. LOR1-02]MDO9711628.1 EexN family lipoprotein [Paracraurococcus sp. LOR1-02]